MKRNKNKPTFIGCYYKWLKEGEMPEQGICASLPISLLDSDSFELIEPTKKDYKKLKKQEESSLYWGSGLKQYDPLRHYTFTPLRQTIMILCALMEGEEV